jgi:hypothetical protein
MANLHNPKRVLFYTAVCIRNQYAMIALHWSGCCDFHMLILLLCSWISVWFSDSGRCCARSVAGDPAVGKICSFSFPPNYLLGSTCFSPFSYELGLQFTIPQKRWRFDNLFYCYICFTCSSVVCVLFFPQPAGLLSSRDENTRGFKKQKMRTDIM